MAIQTRSLGKGLEALLSGIRVSQADQPLEAADPLVMVLLTELHASPFQPRRQFSDAALADLAESITQQGVLQPILVRARASAIGGGYEIIAGERRVRAARLSGLTHIPAIIKSMEDSLVRLVALVENIQRADLNVLEEAHALQAIVQTLSYTHAQVGSMVGRSRAAVSNSIRLLQLRPEVQRLLIAGHLDMGHARALLSVTGPVQEKIALQTVEQGWSVRQIEQKIHAIHAPRRSDPPRTVDPNIRDLESQITQIIGTSVQIVQGKRGGKMVIRYQDLAALEGILAHFKRTDRDSA